MSREIVRVRVVNIQRQPSKGDGYEEREVLDVEDAGGKLFKLTRFVHKNEYRLAEGHVYEGWFKKPNNPQYSDTFEDVAYIKGGFDGIRTPFWPEPVANKAVDDRQKSILTQSDMRTAAILYAGCKNLMGVEMEDYKKLYEEVKAFRESEESK